MKTVGIICEYNPFHNGHKRQIDLLRSMGYDCIVCVMSGNFTERGELAIADKYTRARSAILSGADLVLELPFPYCSTSAEGFAEAGVHILGSLGIDAISFGSESADKDLLTRAADVTLSDEFVKLYTEKQRGSHKGSARAYFEALEELIGNTVPLLSNDILAVSYIAAIKRAQYDVEIVPIKREGLAYNDTSLKENTLPSASAIREAAKCGDLSGVMNSFAPEGAVQCICEAVKIGNCPILASSIEREILSFFKLMTPSEIKARAISRCLGGSSILQDGCGICERLCTAARDSSSLDELLSKAYNAKYTDARINRVLLFSILGVSDCLSDMHPEYTTLLAASKQGRLLLSTLRKEKPFSIITKPADAPDSVQTTLMRAADELFSKAMPSRPSCDYFVKQSPFMLDK